MPNKKRIIYLCLESYKLGEKSSLKIYGDRAYCAWFYKAPVGEFFNAYE